LFVCLFVNQATQVNLVWPSLTGHPRIGPMRTGGGYVRPLLGNNGVFSVLRKSGSSCYLDWVTLSADKAW